MNNILIGKLHMGGIMIEDVTLSAVLKILKDDGIDLKALEKKYEEKLMNNEVSIIPERYRQESLYILKNAINNT